MNLRSWSEIDSSLSVLKYHYRDDWAFCLYTGFCGDFRERDASNLLKDCRQEIIDDAIKISFVPPVGVYISDSLMRIDEFSTTITFEFIVAMLSFCTYYRSAIC